MMQTVNGVEPDRLDVFLTAYSNSPPEKPALAKLVSYAAQFVKV